MRVPLPKSKLVGLALVALLGSGVAAASLAAPGLWSDPAASPGEASQRFQSAFLFSDERGEESDDEERDDHGDDKFDDRFDDD